MDIEQLYRKVQMQKGQTEEFDFENRTVKVKRKENGWIIDSFERSPDTNEERAADAGEYYQTGDAENLIISPALPDKSLVFKGSGLMVLPGQKVLFFLEIPVMVQLYVTKKRPENLVREISLVRLSDTWFGEPDNGEPAYALGDGYSFQMDTIIPGPDKCICPVSVVNNSDTILEVQRLILRVGDLSLYKNKGRMITSIVKVEYRGKDVISELSSSYSKAMHGEKQQLLAAPRNGESRGPLKINFHFIRNILN